MKRILLLGLCAALAVAVIVHAQDGTIEPYQPDWTAVKQDITTAAGEVAVEPRLKAVAEDRFEYEIDFRTTRRGSTRTGGKPAEAFLRDEHWTTSVLYRFEEEVLEGYPDLRMAMSFERMTFLLDLGRARYSGYIGPEQGNAKSAFHEVHLDGSRTETNNIPGWPGINARTINTMRETQARSAAAWFSASELSRMYGELYHADFNSPDQRNYPGRFQDPVQLTLGLFPQFAEGAALKPGETMVVTKRMPVGFAPGATLDYTVTYKLEKLYGSVEEPVAARMSFTATPVVREQVVEVQGMRVSFTAPDFEGGSLLLDLVKGVPLHTHWRYKVKGTIDGSGAAAEIDNEVEFTASLRAPRE